MKKIIAIGIPLFFFSHSVSAQTQSMCEAILKSANYNQFQSVSQNQQYSLRKANFCLEEYEKASNEQKAQIEASYKQLFSANASGSAVQLKERQKQECDSKYGEFWFNQLGLISQKIVSDKAMDTVAQCIAALAAGLRVTPTLTESERAMSVSLTWTHRTKLPFRGIYLAPSTNISCKLDGKDINTPDLFKNRTIKPGTSVTFTCERTAKTENISGENVECLPEALVAIDVLENPVTLNLFRRCETDYLLSRAAEVDKKVADMEKRLAETTKTLQSHQTQAISTLISNKITPLEAKISKFIWLLKENNGTVSCDTYCNNLDKRWPHSSGGCVAAVKEPSHRQGPITGTTCQYNPSLYGHDFILSCLCTAPPP